MVTYTCDRCGYTTARRSTFAKHLIRKFQCKPKVSDATTRAQLTELVVPKAKAHKCDKCGRSYGSRSALGVHQKDPCEPKALSIPKDVASLQVLVEHLTRKCADLEARNEQLEARLAGGPSQAPPTTACFGSEDTSYIPQDAMDNCTELVRSNRESAISHTLLKIFFDPAHPENHNVRLKSARMGTVEVFRGGQWVLDDLKETVKKMVEKSRRHILQRGLLPQANRQREGQCYDAGTSRALQVLQQPLPAHMLCRIRRTVVTSLADCRAQS